MYCVCLLKVVWIECTFSLTQFRCSKKWLLLKEMLAFDKFEIPCHQIFETSLIILIKMVSFSNIVRMLPIFGQYGSTANKDLRSQPFLDKRGRYIRLLLLPLGWYWIRHVTRDRFGRACSSSNILRFLSLVSHVYHHTIYFHFYPLHSLSPKIKHTFVWASFGIANKTNQSFKVLWGRPETGLTPWVPRAFMTDYWKQKVSDPKDRILETEAENEGRHPKKGVYLGLFS